MGISKDGHKFYFWDTEPSDIADRNLVAPATGGAPPFPSDVFYPKRKGAGHFGENRGSVTRALRGVSSGA